MMRGVSTKFESVGRLLREAREHNGITLDAATSMIGLSNLTYLAKIERGEANFPARKLPRAVALYNLDPSILINAILSDYKKSLIDFLGKKN